MIAPEPMLCLGLGLGLSSFLKEEDRDELCQAMFVVFCVSASLLSAALMRAILARHSGVLAVYPFPPVLQF